MTHESRAQGPARQPPASSKKPNIVFILGDNVGYGVLSSYNGGILDTPTPRLDKLAAEGLRLTNFNVENQCTPSRSALMTGRLPIPIWQVNMYDPPVTLPLPKVVNLSPI